MSRRITEDLCDRSDHGIEEKGAGGVQWSAITN